MFCVLLLSSFYFCFDVLRIFLDVVFCMSVFFFFPHPLKPLAFLLFQATWPSSVTGGFVIPFQGQPRLNKLTKLRNVGKKNFVLHKNKNHTSLEQHGVFLNDIFEILIHMIYDSLNPDVEGQLLQKSRFQFLVSKRFWKFCFSNPLEKNTQTGHRVCIRTNAHVVLGLWAWTLGGSRSYKPVSTF